MRPLLTLSGGVTQVESRFRDWKPVQTVEGVHLCVTGRQTTRGRGNGRRRLKSHATASFSDRLDQHFTRRVCMVTGASSGIGKETAGKLAELGATVVMVCRSKERGERAMADVRGRSHNDSVELLLADFASLDSVRALAEAFLKNHDTLHVLINNAGLVRLRRSVTVDGFEVTFQVDYLSHFLLTNLLLGVLKRSAPSRIVNVSSVSHYRGHVDFDDLQMERGYGVMRAYSRAKLADGLFTYELSRKLEGTGVTANCLHPGSVATTMATKPLGPLSFVWKALRPFLLSPREGAESPVYLATAPELERETGKYFDRMIERRSSADSYDRAAAERLWKESERLAGISPAPS